MLEITHISSHPCNDAVHAYVFNFNQILCDKSSSRQSEITKLLFFI